MMPSTTRRYQTRRKIEALLREKALPGETYGQVLARLILEHRQMGVAAMCGVAHSTISVTMVRLGYALRPVLIYPALDMPIPEHGANA